MFSVLKKERKHSVKKPEYCPAMRTSQGRGTVHKQRMREENVESAEFTMWTHMRTWKETDAESNYTQPFIHRLKYTWTV